MTHHSDDQSFEDTLDNAVRDMHRQMPLGNQPSSRAWHLIAEKASIQDQAGSVGTNAARSEPEGAQKQPLSFRSAQPQARATGHLGWSTWLAAALVVALLAGTVTYLMPDNQRGENGNDDSIALAPGMQDAASITPSSDATPASTPYEYIPTYGPEHTCHAEPLTSEQVFDMVINPHREYVRLGDSEGIANLNNPEDAGTDNFYWRPWFLNPVDFSATIVPEETQPIIETVNDFWDCLMTGTAFQVWTFMHPYTVQHEILTHYPVIRDEETLRRHIEEWGPRKYSASIYHAFPDLGNVDPLRASRIVDETPGSIIVRYNSAVGMPIGVGEPFSAIVRVIPADPASSGGYYELLLQRAPDSRWWVTAIYYPG